VHRPIDAAGLVASGYANVANAERADCPENHVVHATPSSAAAHIPGISGASALYGVCYVPHMHPILGLDADRGEEASTRQGLCALPTPSRLVGMDRCWERGRELVIGPLQRGFWGRDSRWPICASPSSSKPQSQLISHKAVRRQSSPRSRARSNATAHRLENGQSSQIT